MPVKQTQFAYDEELWHRYKKLGKTWKQIVVRGIEAFESDVGVKYVGEKPEEPRGKPEKIAVVDENVDAPPEGLFEIIISPEQGIEREFDIFEEDMWQTLDFPQIKEGELFRIRDNNKVVKIKGTKYFSYDDLPYKDDRGRKCAKVYARELV